MYTNAQYTYTGHRLVSMSTWVGNFLKTQKLNLFRSSLKFVPRLDKNLVNNGVPIRRQLRKIFLKNNEMMALKITVH